MVQATNDLVNELADALLGAAHLLLRHPLPGEPAPAAFALLHNLRDQGPVRPADLAANVRLDPSTISRHVQFLETQGYLSKARDPKDGRSYRLKVTAAGRKAIDQARARRVEFIREVIATWPAQDFRMLVFLLRRLSADLKKHLGTPS